MTCVEFVDRLENHSVGRVVKILGHEKVGDLDNRLRIQEKCSEHSLLRFRGVRLGFEEGCSGDHTRGKWVDILSRGRVKGTLKRCDRRPGF